MTREETSRMELRETGGELDKEAQAAGLPSGPLLSTNGGPAVAENGGNVELNVRYEKNRRFSKKRIRVYKVICVSLTIVLSLVLVISLALVIKDSLQKRKGVKTSTVATLTEESSLYSTSRPTIPDVILNIDSVSVSLSLTFPSSIYVDEYSDPNTSQYQEIESNFTRNIDGLLQNGEFSTVYDRVTVDGIRPGSIIIDTTVHLTGIPSHLHDNLASFDIPQMEMFIGSRVQSNIQDGYPTDDILIFQFNGAKVSSPSVSTTPQEITIPIVHNRRCFPCTTSRDCVPLSWVCDGDIDCDGGEDEQNCSCDEGFLCGNGLCVDPNYQCDGLPDCDDGEDEINCTCNSATQYQCPFTNSCIPKSALCDFTPDCPHHEDESEEVCRFESFAENMNVTIGRTSSIDLPIPVQKVGFMGPGAFGLWYFSSPEAPAEFFINVTLGISGNGESFLKFGLGLNATRAPLATFTQQNSVSPSDLNPFYARSEYLWVVLYQSDWDVVQGSFSVTAVPATDCMDGEVACQFSPECIPAGGRCDGNEDCTFTGEDETLCLVPRDPDEIRNNESAYSSSSSFSSSAYFEN